MGVVATGTVQDQENRTPAWRRRVHVSVDLFQRRCSRDGPALDRQRKCGRSRWGRIAIDATSAAQLCDPLGAGLRRQFCRPLIVSRFTGHDRPSFDVLRVSCAKSAAQQSCSRQLQTEHDAVLRIRSSNSRKSRASGNRRKVVIYYRDRRFRTVLGYFGQPPGRAGTPGKHGECGVSRGSWKMPE
jgi:hypothetical protein